MEITQHVWGFTPEGEAIVRYTMANGNGASVVLSNIGAGIVSLAVPDRDGHLADVVLGYAEPNGYLHDHAFMGKTCGRFAGRIAGGVFSLNGTDYRLPQNSGPNHLHGGPAGFANKIWESRVETDRVIFSLVSPAGDQGYPGELSVEVIYDWDEDNVLEITWLARAESDTVVNLTNHTYFNLGGDGSGNIASHLLRLPASRYLPTDRSLIPTGEILPAAGTPMDFLCPKTLGQDIGADFDALQYGGGYDAYWVLDEWQPDSLNRACELCDSHTGRKLEVWTTQPGIQMYTGNYLQGSPTGKTGRSYLNGEGVAIMCQGFPDAPNRSGFPSALLPAGDVYAHKAVYKFTAE